MNREIKLKYAKAMNGLIMPMLTGACWITILILALFALWNWDKAEALRIPEIGISILLFICIGLPLLWATVPDIDTGA